MNAIHIVHPEISPVEYFYCQFKSDKDILDFENTCNWFHGDEISLTPPEAAVIKYNPAEGYYEKLDPVYFKNVLSKKLEVYSAIFHQAQQFFR